MTTIVLAACYGTGSLDDLETGDPDVDGDGVAASLDCDDTNEAISPNATEDCANTIDDDCDGLIDAADDACAADSGA